jgi:hypothetical protein
VKRFIPAIALMAACFIGAVQARESLILADASSDAIASAFKEQKSGVAVAGEGVVSKTLPDDNDGHRHQRFLLRLASGQTVLVAHNIDIAPRLAPLAAGDLVLFKGIYEWNAKGGTIHWTHRDPGGRHAAGWLKSGSQTVQ